MYVEGVKRPKFPAAFRASDYSGVKRVGLVDHAGASPDT